MVTEAEFLKTYDPQGFEHPSVTVDLVLMTIADGVPAALLVHRPEHPGLGLWALPGGFVAIDEGLDAAAVRVLREKAGLDGAFIEQLYTFGAPDRDPRTRIITIAYFALLPADRFAAALAADPARALARLEGPGAEGIVARDAGGAPLPLAFDHAAILETAILRLRGKLDYSVIGFALLPDAFTLRDLQDVHEAILGVALNKTAFRRRMLDKGWLTPTGTRETGTSYRPAELFRLNPTFGAKGG